MNHTNLEEFLHLLLEWDHELWWPLLPNGVSCRKDLAGSPQGKRSPEPVDQPTEQDPSLLWSPQIVPLAQVSFLLDSATDWNGSKII